MIGSFLIADQIVYQEPVRLLLDAESTGTKALNIGQKEADGGYVVKDFTIMADNSVLLPDARTGIVFRYGNGKLIRTYDYDLAEQGLFPYKIAADLLGNIYLLDGKQSMLMKINTDGDIHYSRLNDFKLEGVSEFSVAEENVVLFSAIHPEITEVCTYRVDVSQDTAKVLGDKITGKVAGDRIFKPVLIPDRAGESVGHACKIEFYDLEMNPIDSLTLTSERYLLGAQFYGETAGGYAFKVVEMEEIDGEVKIYDCFKIVDEQGNSEETYTIPNENDFTLKAFNQRVYLFTQSDTQIEIREAFTGAQQDQTKADRR